MAFTSFGGKTGSFFGNANLNKSPGGMLSGLVPSQEEPVPTYAEKTSRQFGQGQLDNDRYRTASAYAYQQNSLSSADAQNKRQHEANMYGLQSGRLNDQLRAGVDTNAANQQANASVRGSQFGAQSQKDASAFNAYGNLGIAGLNAMGQYGSSRNQALANSQIAQANALGQMANAYYNTMGQGLQYSAALGAAGAAASGESNRSAAAGNALGGLMGGGGAAGGGFSFSGPGGFSGQGYFGGQQGGGSGGGGPPAPYWNPNASVGMGLASIDNFRRDLNQSGSMGDRFRSDANSAFAATQRNLMNPSVQSDMMSQMRMGYGALDGLYGMSDYGLNTGQFGISGNPMYGSLGFMNSPRAA